VVHLVRTEVQQGREQQYIRRDAPEYVGDLVGRRHCPLDSAEEPAEQCQSCPRSQSRDASDGDRQSRCLLGGARAELRRVVPAWIEIAPVIERGAHTGGQRIPETVPCGWQQFERDGGVIRGQDVSHFLAVGGIAPFGEQVQFVTPLREQTDGRLKIPEEPEMRRGKEDLQLTVRQGGGEDGALVMSLII